MSGSHAGVVVADLGSGNVRVGWGGGGLPAHVVPLAELGDPVPIKRGLVTDWEGVTRVWEQVFEKALEVAPSNHPLLLADSPTTEEKDREKMAEILFETFGVPAYFVASQSVLSVYSAGRTSAIVIECGHSVTHAMAVHEGFAFPHTIMRLELGGQDITRNLQELLAERHVSLGEGPAGLATANAIKETYGEVALDYAQQAHALKVHPQDVPGYQLPDGTTVQLQTEHVRCAEALFHPQLAGCRGQGLADMLCDIVEVCMADREGGPMRPLPQFVLLAGGTSLLPGLEDRLRRAVETRAGMALDMYISCARTPERHHAAWVGGSLLAHLPQFVDNNFVHLGEYSEEGASVVHKRCC